MGHQEKGRDLSISNSVAALWVATFCEWLSAILGRCDCYGRRSDGLVTVVFFYLDCVGGVGAAVGEFMPADEVRDRAHRHFP